MANHYTAHKDEWKVLANIDYYGMFVKSYIPFNAWLNVCYQTLNTDRAKINEIKKVSNPFKSKICSLFDSDSQDGAAFRNAIGDLHYLLENHYIYNKDERITFTHIIIGKNQDNISESSNRGIGFRVQYGNRTPNNTETTTLIKHRDESAIFSFTQQDYNLAELKTNRNFMSLTENYQQIIVNCYERVNPNVIEDFTKNVDSKKESTYYQCGIYKLKRNNELFAAALIEIIYKMRNTLFHGELIPDKDANKTYGAAYKILRILIDAI